MAQASVWQAPRLLPPATGISYLLLRCSRADRRMTYNTDVNSTGVAGVGDSVLLRGSLYFEKDCSHACRLCSPGFKHKQYRCSSRFG